MTGIGEPLSLVRTTAVSAAAATLDALQQFGANSRGVIVIDCEAPLPDLASMSDLGVRGIRVNFVSPQTWGRTDEERLVKTARIAESMGWHIQIYARSQQIAELENTISKLHVPIVIDHMGSFPVQSTSQPVAGHLAILRLLQKGRTWLKLSGPYIMSKAATAGYVDLDPIARTYVAAAVERLVWGSDWPHRGQRQNYPNDAALLDKLLDWAPRRADQERILVTNPKSLYNFQ